MSKILILISFLILTTHQMNISIGGIFDLTGVTDINSADLQYGFLHAINTVNRNASLLPNHSLVPYLGADFCSTDTSEFLRIQKESEFSLIGVVGPFCSVTAEVMLFVSDIYSVPLVSPSASSPSLSDNLLYPMFARIVNSDLELANVWYQLVEFYDMKNVNVLYSSELVHFKTASEFIELCEENGILVQSQSFVGSYNHSFESEIEILRNTGVNNFFLASYEDDARNVFRTAHAYGITGLGYYWFGSDSWAYENMLSDDIVKEAILGSIVVFPKSNFDGYDTWLEGLNIDFPESTGSSRTPYAYDSMLVFAKALHQVIEINGNPFEVTDDFKTLLFDAILDTDFDSITGTVKFNELGDRTNLPYDILNFQLSGLVTVGTSENHILSINNDIIWPGNISNDGLSLPRKVIRFSASVPYNSNIWPIGHIAFPGLQLAIDEINSNNSLLPNFYLDFTLLDSECSGLVALAKFVDSFDESGRSFLFHVGDGCSVASQPLAQLTAIWSMPMISWGSTSASLSDKEIYPFFRRTVSPDTFQGQAWYYFVKEMGWNSVATINSNEDIHALLVNEFTSISGERGNLTILTQEVFPSGDPSDISLQLLNIQSKGARIILLSSYANDAILILNEAYNLGMTGENGYVWIGTDSWFLSTIIANVSENWQGIIGLNPALGSNDVSEKLWETLFSDPEYAYPLSIRDPYTETIYDAAYAFALSLHELLEIDQEIYLPDDNLRNALFEKLNFTDFEGANGRIRFNADGDRMINYAVLNLQGDAFVNVGTLDPSSGVLTFSDDAIVWGTGNEDIPMDHPVRTTIPLSPVLVTIFYILSIVGLVSTFFFMVILIWQRKNNVFVAARVIFCGILLACGFMAYSSIFFLNVVTEVTCWIYPWLVHIPLILAISCILSKAWRVYVIFIKNKEKLKIVKITDQRLLAWIGVFLGAAGLYLTICMIINPYVRTTIINELNPEEQYVICRIRDEAFSIWPIVLIAAESVLVIIGVVLAYLTRRVELLNYNESSFIGICVYNLLFTGAVLVPLSYLITEEQVNAQFAILAAGIILNISVLIFYFFITRINFILNGRAEESGGAASGTRNFKVSHQK